ncbi:MAG: hypothetical protein MJE77_08810 [Proteobacteria bacterium]|nr:hypothetical protein [Pseudomonadota bacterium]
MKRIIALFCLLLTTGCGVDDAASGGDDQPDASAGPTEGLSGPTAGLANVFGVPNLDDDNNTGTDWDEPRFPEDDDLASLVLSADNLDVLASGADLTLSLTGDTTKIRVYRGADLILGEGAPGEHYRFTPPGGDVEFTIEFGDFLAAGTLSIERVDASGVQGGSIFGGN